MNVEQQRDVQRCVDKVVPRVNPAVRYPYAPMVSLQQLFLEPFYYFFKDLRNFFDDG